MTVPEALADSDLQDFQEEDQPISVFPTLSLASFLSR